MITRERMAHERGGTPASHSFLSKICRVALVLFAFAPVACAAGDKSDAAVTVRFGYFPNLTHAQALIGMAAERGDFAKALGATAQVEPKIFNAGPAEIEALFAGEIDLAYVGPSPAINGFVRSKGEALRIIAGAVSGGAVLVVRADANIKEVKDFAGKRIATPQLGNTQDVALRYYLLTNNLAPQEKGGTVSIVPTDNPNILTLFQKKEIDAAWVPEPWGARLVKEGNAAVFLDERDLWQPDRKFVTANVIISTKFATAHPDLVKRWLTAHVELTQWINENPTDAKRIANAEIARLTGKALPPDELDDAWKRLDVTYDPVSSSLYADADRGFTLGFLGKDKPNLNGIYDLSWLNQVLTEKNLPTVK
jgi:sulfonate transport system substrate-binding protein